MYYLNNFLLKLMNASGETATTKNSTANSHLNAM